MVALQKVTAEQKAVHTIEKQHSDIARHSRAHCPQLKVAKKPTMKRVCLHLLLLLLLMTTALLQKRQLHPPLLLPAPFQKPHANTSQESIKEVDTISDSGFSIGNCNINTFWPFSWEQSRASQISTQETTEVQCDVTFHVWKKRNLCA